MMLRSQRAIADETGEYRDLVLFAATKIAEAAFRSSFCSIGGLRVSEAERRMLDDLVQALSASGS